MPKLVLSGATKIMDIINEYPFLTDILEELDPILRRFKNPILRKTVGRRATLTDVSDMINKDLDVVISFFTSKIERETNIKIEQEVGSVRKSGWEDEHTRKREMLKALVLELHAGGELPSLKARFKEILGDIEATDIASMEQELIDSGELTVDQITLLCDLHVGIFEDTLAEHQKPQTVSGHPIHTYMAENTEAKNLIAKLRENPSPVLIEELAKIEIHYTRLENQLFPLLEKKNFAGPSQVMWAKHDETRQLLRKRENVDVQELTSQIEDMIFKEETILFPTSLELLTTLDWQTVKHGEEEIGFAWVTPGDEWKPLTPEIIHQSPQTDKGLEGLQLNTGKLTLEQIDLMLTHLPIEISYINTQDEVLYYSGTKERIFPRSPGVIGRKVQKCHPPKSLDKVNEIIAAFKAGRKGKAEFWITMNGKFLHIRYFAVRNDSGVYQGTLEVMQDVTSIRALEGERRLVNWEN